MLTVLRVEPRAPLVLGKCFTTERHIPALTVKFFMSYLNPETSLLRETKQQHQEVLVTTTLISVLDLVFSQAGRSFISSSHLVSLLFA